MFVIEDDWHAEPQGEYPDVATAWAELEQRSTIPWDHAPNIAPCVSWRTCGRSYELNEYDTSVLPWGRVRQISVLEIDSKGVRWMARSSDGAWPVMA